MGACMHLVSSRILTLLPSDFKLGSAEEKSPAFKNTVQKGTPSTFSQTCPLLTLEYTRFSHHSIFSGAGWVLWSSELLLSWNFGRLYLVSKSSQPYCCSESVFSWCCWNEGGCLSRSGQKIYQFGIPVIKACHTNWNQFHISHFDNNYQTNGSYFWLLQIGIALKSVEGDWFIPAGGDDYLQVLSLPHPTLLPNLQFSFLKLI